MLLNISAQPGLSCSLASLQSPGQAGVSRARGPSRLATRGLASQERPLDSQRTSVSANQRPGSEAAIVVENCQEKQQQALWWPLEEKLLIISRSSSLPAQEMRITMRFLPHLPHPDWMLFCCPLPTPTGSWRSKQRAKQQTINFSSQHQIRSELLPSIATPLTLRLQRHCRHCSPALQCDGTYCMLYTCTVSARLSRTVRNLYGGILSSSN